MAHLGRLIQGELDEIEADNKYDRDRQAQRVMDSYFKDPDEEPRPGSFADPALMF